MLQTLLSIALKTICHHLTITRCKYGRETAHTFKYMYRNLDFEFLLISYSSWEWTLLLRVTKHVYFSLCFLNEVYASILSSSLFPPFPKSLQICLIVWFVTISIAYRCVLDFQNDWIRQSAFFGVPLLLLFVSNCISPYLSMSSISDYKVRGRRRWTGRKRGRGRRKVRMKEEIWRLGAGVGENE